MPFRPATPDILIPGSAAARKIVSSHSSSEKLPSRVPLHPLFSRFFPCNNLPLPSYNDTSSPQPRLCSSASLPTYKLHACSRTISQQNRTISQQSRSISQLPLTRPSLLRLATVSIVCVKCAITSQCRNDARAPRAILLTWTVSQAFLNILQLLRLLVNGACVAVRNVPRLIAR
ncbi:unnamed protein product [Chondrus crispus]|uniref:Uncharacterized protein n=1 Tax=Chondrus crispus TaxID=2769 RepID=R7QDH6_CHOCR|nr:unnamed protein product [Chondrus crispus]CDF36139.1 unnamed protein product [Chondrus crispus]|eukprot:XP_005715958.1 unnamed protein product [Chondrus crispus]